MSDTDEFCDDLKINEQDDDDDDLDYDDVVSDSEISIKAFRSEPDLTLSKQLTQSTNENLVGYSEQYQEFFNGTINAQDEPDVFTQSQLGSVIWSPEEKAVFFSALSRKGRHDLPSLSRCVGTKSILEIRDYLTHIQEAFIERQKFEKDTKAVSSADIEAAVEIDPELEAVLENAADALAKTQNRYDECQAANDATLTGPWIYNAESADALAQRIELQADFKDAEDDPTSTREPLRAVELLNIGTMLELSRNLFMNIPAEKMHDHWHDLVDDTYTEPAIMTEALESFYGLIRLFTQRVLQSAIFLAKSRIRAMTALDHLPGALLRDVDITAALDIMGAPRDSFEYWAAFPKRSGMKVYLGAHDRGKGGQRALTAQEIDSVLATRAIRGRRRSLSSMVSMSSQDSIGNGVEATIAREVQDGQEECSDRSDDNTENSRVDESETESLLESEPSDSDPGVIDESTGSQKAGIKRRRLSVEESEQEDAFLEALDRDASLEEGHRLREWLGLSIMTEPALNEHKRKRPKVSRKTKDELLDWADFVFPQGWQLPTLQLRPRSLLSTDHLR